MKRSALLAALLQAGFIVAGHAADADKNKPVKNQILPPVNLNGYLQGYSVELDTDNPSQSPAPKPSGLDALKDDPALPFVGLKLSTPLDTK